MMTIAEFRSLDHDSVFQYGVFFLEGQQYKYCFKKGFGHDWAAYYLFEGNPDDVTKYGSKMSFTMVKKLTTNKDLLNLYRS